MSISLQRNLEVLDWTGRQERLAKCGSARPAAFPCCVGRFSNFNGEPFGPLANAAHQIRGQTITTLFDCITCRGIVSTSTDLGQGHSRAIAVPAKPYVFVLMPFAKPFSDVYELGIKAACEAANGYCERVDEQMFCERILDRIYNQIAKADVIVAEMSSHNPNVYYEVGYAHGISKQNCILLIKKGETIPFDLNQHPHIVYETIAELRQQLEQRLTWCFEHLGESLVAVDSGIEVWIDGEQLKEGVPGYCEIVASIPLSIGHTQFELRLDIHNASHLIHEAPMDVCLLIPDSIEPVDPEVRLVKVGFSRRMLISRPSESILPDGWIPVSFLLGYVGSFPAIEFEIQLLTPVSNHKRTFSVQLWDPPEPDGPTFV